MMLPVDQAKYYSRCHFRPTQLVVSESTKKKKKRKEKKKTIAAACKCEKYEIVDIRAEQSNNRNGLHLHLFESNQFSVKTERFHL